MTTKKQKMNLQDILNRKEIQQELDQKMRDSWSGIPKGFKPILDLNNPYSLQDLTRINIIGRYNGSKASITLKELNFLYHYCFVIDFYFFYQYQRATTQHRKCFSFPMDLKKFRSFSLMADICALTLYVKLYQRELDNYINITGRNCLYLILD